MPVGQRVATDLRVGARIVDIDDAADGLVLEPLAGVPHMDAGTLGEVGRRRGPAIGEGLVQTEALAEVDRLEVERPEGGLEQASRQRVATSLGFGDGVLDGGGRSRHGARGCQPRPASTMDIRRVVATTAPSRPRVSRRRPPRAAASGIGRWTSTGRM